MQLAVPSFAVSADSVKMLRFPCLRLASIYIIGLKMAAASNYLLLLLSPSWRFELSPLINANNPKYEGVISQKIEDGC